MGLAYCNGNAAGAAVEKKIAQERAYQEAHAQQTQAPKGHPDLADIDRAISGMTELVRQLRARVANVADVLVGERPPEATANTVPAPTPINGQIGALISSVQYAGFALQDLTQQIQRLENAVGV